MKLISAKASDIPWIRSLESLDENKNFVWQASYEDHLSEIDDPSSFLFVHINNHGEKVGFSLNVFNQRSCSFEIRRLVIDKKGQGYGKASMLTLLDFGFNELKAQRVWLDVYPDNEIGINLYRNLGFIQEGHLRRSDFHRGDYQDQLIFSMLIEEYKNII